MLNFPVSAPKNGGGGEREGLYESAVRPWLPEGRDASGGGGKGEGNSNAFPLIGKNGGDGGKRQNRYGGLSYGLVPLTREDCYRMHSIRLRKLDNGKRTEVRRARARRQIRYREIAPADKSAWLAASLRGGGCWRSSRGQDCSPPPRDTLAPPPKHPPTPTTSGGDYWPPLEKRKTDRRRARRGQSEAADRFRDVQELLTSLLLGFINGLFWPFIL